MQRRARCPPTPPEKRATAECALSKAQHGVRGEEDELALNVGSQQTETAVHNSIGGGWGACCLSSVLGQRCLVHLPPRYSTCRHPSGRTGARASPPTDGSITKSTPSRLAARPVMGEQSSVPRRLSAQSRGCEPSKEEPPGGRQLHVLTLKVQYLADRGISTISGTAATMNPVQG